MNLKELLNNPPSLHESGGKPFTYTLSNEALSFIDEHINSESKTLETGAGVSTVLFALKGTQHTCIVPDQAQVQRIKEFCNQNQISTDKIDFRIDGSENVLPQLRPVGLDLVLIDGCHGFPAPFIDWYYAGLGLKANGILIVDDTQLWTGDVLKQFLLAEPEWKHECDIRSRTSVFQKLKESDLLKEWPLQPYTLLHSKLGEGDDAVNSFSARSGRAVRHILSGEFLILAKKIIRNTIG
ncbi:MAG TPA: class I SAM-dependent methyltransferase [Pyrinomonadaceae bacterium]|jgi:Predicted O-methyltransferase|nr:class I SAM-dependent methyltransferase [Pyrinomonadaceae bacterium]